MDSLELKRTKLELLRVSTARAEMEFRVEERLEEIKRIKENIKLQEDKEKELNNKIKTLGG